MLNSDPPATQFPAIQRSSVPHSMQIALFFTGLLWMLAARTAAEHAALGISTRLDFIAVQPLLTEGFSLFLLLAGFTALHWIATREGDVRAVNALPKRDTVRQEWSVGAALGWALLLVALLPMMLAGDLHPQFWLAARSWGLAVLSLAALALGALTLEVAFRGYLYKRMIEAAGPVAATVIMSALYAILASFRTNSSMLGLVVAFVAGLLFSLAYLRTHALWLGWGLHFAWSASMAVLFGLPVRGAADYSSLVETTTSGADWFTGGAFGPDGAVFTVLVLLAGSIVLYQISKDYAWKYTHPPIVAGGYPVMVQPPAAHTAMEQAAVAAPAPLVQIAVATSSNASSVPEIEEHLRSHSSSE